MCFVRRFFKIIDRRQYRDQTEYLIMWNENDRSLDFEWKTENQLFVDFDIGNHAIFQRFHEWYYINRFGSAPSALNVQWPIFGNGISDLERFAAMRFNPLNKFMRTLQQTILRYIMDGLFSFDTGFRDQEDPPLDRKLVESHFLREVYLAWFHRLKGSNFSFISRVAGRNTWYATEHDDLIEEADKFGYGEYRSYRSAKEFSTFAFTSVRPIVFLHCSPNEWIPNAYSVIIKQWGRSSECKHVTHSQLF